MTVRFQPIRFRVWADFTGDGNVWVPISDQFRVRGAAEGWAAHLAVGAWEIRQEEIDDEENGGA